MSKTDWFSAEILKYISGGTPDVIDVTGQPTLQVACFTATPGDGADADQGTVQTWVGANEVDNTPSSGDDSNYSRQNLAWNTLASTANGQELTINGDITMNSTGSLDDNGGGYSIAGWGLVDADDNMYYFSDETASVNSGDIVKFTDTNLKVAEE